MNIGKSTRIALIHKDKDQTWLADQLSVSRVQASRICNNENANTTRVQELAKIFEMNATDFIALADKND